MGKICTFCKYNESKDKCGLIESMASVKHTERCTCYEPVKNVAPVVHAHKVRAHSQGGGTHWLVCSHCEQPIDWQDAYCKHCGAKMDEEV